MPAVGLCLLLLAAPAAPAGDSPPPAPVAQLEVPEAPTVERSLLLTVALGAIAAMPIALAGAGAALVAGALSMSPFTLALTAGLIGPTAMVGAGAVGLLVGGSAATVVILVGAGVDSWSWFVDHRPKILASVLAGLPVLAGAMVGFGVPIALVALASTTLLPALGVSPANPAFGDLNAALGLGVPLLVISTGLLVAAAGGAGGGLLAWTATYGLDALVERLPLRDLAHGSPASQE